MVRGKFYNASVYEKLIKIKRNQIFNNEKKNQWKVWVYQSYVSFIIQRSKKLRTCGEKFENLSTLSLLIGKFKNNLFNKKLKFKKNWINQICHFSFHVFHAFLRPNEMCFVDLIAFRSILNQELNFLAGKWMKVVVNE